MEQNPNVAADSAVDPLAGMNKVPSNWITWGKIGDFIKGTLVRVYEVDNKMPGKEGTKQKIYEVVSHAGRFHDIDENKRVIETPVNINADEFWQIGGKEGIDAQMRNVKLGTIIGMRFDKEVPAKQKGYNPSKIIVVVTGGRDPNYTGNDSTMSPEIDSSNLPQ